MQKIKTITKLTLATIMLVPLMITGIICLTTFILVALILATIEELTK